MKGVCCSIAAALTLFALAGTASASTGDASSVEILKKAPYYLSLHRPDARPRGTILAIPGGGWSDNSQPGLVEKKMADWIPRLVELGYQVATVGPRGGTFSIDDSLSAFDLIRKLYPRQPVCALGGSSGAHVALMVAVDRGDEVSCVVDHAGPPDLEQEPAPSRFWPFNFIVQKVREVTKLATAAFGAAQLAILSPINRIAEIESPVFIAAASCDPYIPIGDQQKFEGLLQAAGKSAQLFQFQPGKEAFASHCGVTLSSYQAYEHAEDAFLQHHLAAFAPKRRHRHNHHHHHP